MGKKFGSKRWNRGWTCGLPVDSPLLGFGTVKNSPGVCEKWAINVHVFWYGLGREWPWIAGSQGEPLICNFSGILTEGFHYSRNSVLRIYFREIMCLVK